MPKVGSDEVAAALGISPRQVRNLAKAGTFSTAERGEKSWTFDLATTVAEYNRAKLASDDDGTDWKTEREKQDARIKKTKADMLDLEFREMQGQYYRAEFIRDAWLDFSYAVRSGILSLPGKLAPVLGETAEQKARISEAIDAECRQLCESLSTYEFDLPDYYHERLKEERRFVPEQGGDDD